MPAYNTSLFNPPAPLAYVTIRNPDNGIVWLDVPMLLDSGADVSLVPEECVNRLGITAAPTRHYQLIGFNGSTSLAPVVRLELLLCGRTFRGQFLLIGQPWGIIGRNIMNALCLVFDGPQLSWRAL